ncbi:NACHT domain-containing protein [Microlunatus ginsengisoli]|uniref:NACHT domain-containing protein n=1 Tax=Microlunatus ginsengisoli TaxID=363863 RepID=A0ABP7ANI3_9ACTN
MLETLLLQLGTSAAKAVAKMWIKSEVAITLTDGVIDQLSGRVSSITERRRTSRQFAVMAERIAEQLAPLLDNEYRGLAENEKLATLVAVTNVIGTVQHLDPSNLFAIDLDPTALEHLLTESPSMKERDDLNPPAQYLFDRLLRENCSYVVELAAGLPSFTSSALVELLRRETHIQNVVETILSQIPQPEVERESEDQQFELRYRRQVSRVLNQLELFGLSLSEASARYQLSVAYITLTASMSQHFVPTAGHETDNDDEAEVDRSSDEGAVFPVDEVLASSNRHVIRGEAGSGKTTLLQWLAVTAARDAFEGPLESWSRMIPIFLQLRRYANSQLPLPQEFLHHVAGNIVGIMPPGWVHRQMDAGRVLLLLDGVDELPENQRDSARDWLQELLIQFPQCRFVVTTRPPAVPEDWLAEAGFAVSELTPMGTADIVAFVEHWYAAARRLNTNAEDMQLARFERDLIAKIREVPSLRGLASTPLLCAMLCALNRDRRTKLPRDRMELYRIALESLLERRDIEREIAVADIDLGLREKEMLLQDLAFWLLLNSRSDLERDVAISRVALRLPYLPAIEASPSDVFDYLLVRSGLIREPVEGRIDFIHRTFQEYLAAARVVTEENIPLLIEKATDDQWRETVILGVGHASPKQRDSLLRGLLKRGREENSNRHRLYLLAGACLETAVELNPDTTAAVHASLAQALPPINMTEARAVASAGSETATLLAQFVGRRASVAAACVRALCLIGTDGALEVLKAYRADSRRTVVRELLRGWDNFECDRYAREILSHAKLEGTLELNDLEALDAVDHLQNVSSVAFTGSSSLRSLSRLRNIDKLTELNLPNGSQIADLQPIEGMTSLKSLLIHQAEMTSLPILPDSLQTLKLESCRQLADISALRHHPSIRSLQITQPAAEIDLSPLADTRLTDLDLSLRARATVRAPDWLPRDGRLRSLKLRSIMGEGRRFGFSLGAGHSCNALKRHDDLHTLELSPVSGDMRSLEGIAAGISTLVLHDCVHLADASQLAGSKLEKLVLWDAAELVDFRFLATLTELRDLNLRGCKGFNDLKLLRAASKLQFLEISDTGISDLTGIGDQHPSLGMLSLSGCPLDSLDPLIGVEDCWILLDRKLSRLITDELRAQNDIFATAYVEDEDDD